MSPHRAVLALVAFALFAAVSVDCTPTPKFVRCDDDASCTAVDPNFAYCVQKRCVECLGNAGCGRDNLCVSGRCERKCRDARDCRGGEVCNDGECAAD